MRYSSKLIVHCSIGRAKADRLSQKAQYLWHTSHALYDAVKHGEKTARRSGETLVPLSRFVTLAKVFSDSHPFVLSILRVRKSTVQAQLIILKYKSLFICQFDQKVNLNCNLFAGEANFFCCF